MWRDVARCGEIWRDVSRHGEMWREISGETSSLRPRRQPVPARPHPHGHRQIVRGRLGAGATVSAFVAHFVAGYTREKARVYK